MTAPSTPGNVDECWPKVVHTVHAVVQILDSLRSLGGEEFEGDSRLVLLVGEGKHGGDVHLDDLSL